VDIGEGVFQISLVYDGYLDPSSVIRNDLSGIYITDYLMKLLNERGHLFSRQDREIIKAMKEKICYLPLDFEQELDLYNSDKSKKMNIGFKLPDGHIIEVGNERFRCSEVLFQPGLIGVEMPGVHELVYKAIMESQIDIRREFFTDIILAGGTTNMKGFPGRLKKEMTALVPASVKIKLIVHDEDRSLSAWIGGSILSRISVFQQMWLSKEEYDEAGPSIGNRRGRCY